MQNSHLNVNVCVGLVYAANKCAIAVINKASAVFCCWLLLLLVNSGVLIEIQITNFCCCCCCC